MDVNVDVARGVRLVRPRTGNQLDAWVRAVLGCRVPRRAVVEGHDAPFDYLAHAFFETGEKDCVVWANRGGGKTHLGAIATLLDLLFKPGVQVRILGGSLEQAGRMHKALRSMLVSDVFEDLIAGNVTEKGVELKHGSRAEILAQSEKAVRGERVHKLRCDEVELFEPEVWDAAQLVTRSGVCGGVTVRGSVEAISTMHRPYGLMRRLIETAEAERRRVFRWSLPEVLERCPPARSCEGCGLWADCRGSAKEARGFLRIDDALRQKKRVGEATWRSEMLCLEPSKTNLVYAEFDPSTHVRRFEAPRTRAEVERVTWVAGIDFGFRSPTVLLWAYVDEGGVLRVVDEHVKRDWTTHQHLAAAAEKAWPKPAWIGADPAGHQRSEHTGVSTITLWRAAGWRVRSRRLPIEAGVRAVKARLKRADGTPGMVIHPRCRVLIDSLKGYHYPADVAVDRLDEAVPVKDGSDHAADALRYLVVNLDAGWGKVVVREYW